MIQREPKTYPVKLADLSLQVTEWPGDSGPVLLLHATGFHSRCWDSIAHLLPELHLYAVDLRFHGGSDSHGKVDWQLMSRDIEELLDVLDLQQMVGVGHSMGGFITAFVAARQRARFKQLVLIDPVIFSRQRYEHYQDSWGSMKPTDNPISRRKNRWQSPQEMYLRFKNRVPFDTWQDQALRDYCDHALREVPGESDLQLACDPLDEAAIYINHDGNIAIHDLLPKLTLPVTVLRTRQDLENPHNLSASPTWSGLAAALPHAREIYLPDMSHFIPMEDPQLVAEIIRQAMQEKWRSVAAAEAASIPKP